MALNISDEELTAYLDGEADPELVARIKDIMDHDASISMRLEGLRFDLGALKDQANLMMPNMPSNIVPPAPATRGHGMMGAAMAACLALGLGLGLTLSNRPTEQAGWTQYVAAYQALYVEGTLANVDSETGSVAELSNILGRDLAPAVESPELLFKRAQLLGFKGKPLIQMAYLSEGGAPMALCIIKKTGDASPMSQSVLEGMQAASWSDGEFAYLLIGGTDPDLIKRSADHFEARL